VRALPRQLTVQSTTATADASANRRVAAIRRCRASLAAAAPPLSRPQQPRRQKSHLPPPDLPSHEPAPSAGRGLRPVPPYKKNTRDIAEFWWQKITGKNASLMGIVEGPTPPPTVSARSREVQHPQYRGPALSRIRGFSRDLNPRSAGL